MILRDLLERLDRLPKMHLDHDGVLHIIATPKIEGAPKQDLVVSTERTSVVLIQEEADCYGYPGADPGED